jgi:hypothetical protein
MTISARDDAAIAREVRSDDRGMFKILRQDLPEDKYIFDGLGGTTTRQITNAVVRIPLPEPGGLYQIVASGQIAYCSVGGIATTPTVAVGGFEFPAIESSWMPHPVRLGGTHLCFIGAVATLGFLTLVHLRRV